MAGDSTFHLWLEPLRLQGVEGGRLRVGAPDELRSWVTERFGNLLRDCVTRVAGDDSEIEIVALEPGGGRPAAPVVPAELPARPVVPPEHFNPKYTFGQFVIGDNNRLAHAAALAVAELPGHAYNPMFIYGPPGVGKTHLLHAIGNYLQEHEPALRVRYATAEAFTGHYVSASRCGDFAPFKAAFRGNDVLLVDDVQFLMDKSRTEEEFFHTFNALREAGAQLVLSCDRLPSDLDALQDRLRERFAAGLVCDMTSPDLATRMTILRMRACRDEAPLQEDALRVLAERITTNVRVLEGAVVRMVALGSLTGRALDAGLAREVVEGLRPGSAPALARVPTVGEIRDAVCDSFGVSQSDLDSKSRATRHTWPRQVAMFLCRELTPETLPAIGRMFGGRNHATVLHAVKRTGERMAADQSAFNTVTSLTDRLQRST